MPRASKSAQARVWVASHWGLLFACLGCASQREALPSPPRPIVLGQATILPPAFRVLASPPQRAAEFLVAPKLLELRQVARAQAELRQGPGVAFKLRERLLERGEELVLTESVGVWRKVLTLSRQPDEGWIHHKMLDPLLPDASKAPLRLPLGRLPLVFAVRALSSLESYPAKVSLPVHIPKGASFVALKKSRRDTLIWIAETNSLAWMRTDDVH